MTALLSFDDKMVTALYLSVCAWACVSGILLTLENARQVPDLLLVAGYDAGTDTRSRGRRLPGF